MSEQSNNSEKNNLCRGVQRKEDAGRCSEAQPAQQDTAVPSSAGVASPEQMEEPVAEQGSISYGEIGHYRIAARRDSTTRIHASAESDVAAAQGASPSGASTSNGPLRQKNPRDPSSVLLRAFEDTEEDGQPSTIAQPSADATARDPVPSIPRTQSPNQPIMNPNDAAEMLRQLQAQLLAASLVMQLQHLSSVGQMPSMSSVFSGNPSFVAPTSIHAQSRTTDQNQMLLFLLRQFLTETSTQPGILTILQQLSTANPPVPAQPVPVPPSPAADMTAALWTLLAQLGPSLSSGQSGMTTNSTNAQDSSMVSSHQSGLADPVPPSGVAVLQPLPRDSPQSQSRQRRRYQMEAFPCKLHRLICDAMAEGKGDIGKSIKSIDCFCAFHWLYPVSHPLTCSKVHRRW